METVEVRLLGGFEVTVDGRSVGSGAYAQRRAADLVKLLALARDHRMARDEVVEALWPHLDADAGLANLHKAASYARKALGGKDAIVLRQGLVELAPAAEVVTDVERFETGDDAAYGGELLPDDRYETWAVEARERLRDRSLDVLRRAGRWGEVLEQDPTDEEARRALMRARAGTGDVAGAAEQFRRLRDELARLGLRPSQETLDLRSELLRGPPVHAPRLLDGPLLGRDAEVVAATDILGGAGGLGGTLFVLGDPGIGKTLLVEAILASAEDRGRHTLRGQAHDEVGGTPYGPLLEALEPLMLERPDLTAGLDERMRGVLALLAPAAGGPAAERATRQEVMSAVSALLVAAARERGVVLALEDLHAADDATLLVVHYLARVARREPLVVIAAARHGEAGGTLARVRSGLVERRAASEVVLGPLGDASVAERAAGRPLGARALGAITTAAAGNPFFAEELAANVAATGDVELPAHVAEVLDARLARLPAPGRALLPVLAVLDDGFGPEEVAEVAGVEGADAAAALEDAAARGVLARTAGRYRFRHPLLRDAARARLEPERLRAAHADAARALAERAAAPEQVARHLLEAGRGAEAVPLLRDAARVGADKGAYADARTLVERALEHAGSDDHAELLELLGDLRHATGDRRAPAAYARALGLVTDDVAPRLRVKAAAAHIAVGAVEAATAELALVPEAAFDDDQVALFTRGMVAWHAGDMTQARRDADRAAEVAARSGGLTERVADLQAMVAHADGTWEEFAAWQLGDTWHVPAVAGHVFDAYLCVTEYVLHAGDPYDRLADFARRLRTQARDAGARRGRRARAPRRDRLAGARAGRGRGTARGRRGSRRRRARAPRRGVLARRCCRRDGAASRRGERGRATRRRRRRPRGSRAPRR